MKQLFFLITLFCLSFNMSAQEKRAPSPSAKIEQRVGLTDITVEYSRPGLKDRAVFAENSPLAPLGKVWRTGANSATKITFSQDVKVGGQSVSAGSYAMLTTPGANTWNISLYPHTATRWTTYRDASPALSITATPVKMGESIETFMIEFDALKDYSASIILGWGNTLVPIAVEVN